MNNSIFSLLQTFSQYNLSVHTLARDSPFIYLLIWASLGKIFLFTSLSKLVQFEK